MYRNSPPLCTIVLQIPSLMPLKMRKVQLIEDAIIAAIRKARFVVSDFTPGDDGARGSVYYEAGFAHGLNLTVICTCRHDKLKLVHFDTSHFNHIAWTDYEDLKTRLLQRIESLIGRGPLESLDEASSADNGTLLYDGE